MQDYIALTMISRCFVNTVQRPIFFMCRSKTMSCISASVHVQSVELWIT